MALDMRISGNELVSVLYSLDRPTDALHFAQALGGYREQSWHSAEGIYRWVSEGDGERVERIDGKSFDQIAFSIPIDYRALPKNYAPFSPFSEGSMLIYSGQFHACMAPPCDGLGELPMTVTAHDRVVGLAGRRFHDHTNFVSDKDGTNIFVGTLAPVDADGFTAIIDPGLPDDLRHHLDQSLPRSIRDLAKIYGSLSFTPELYVSIDARPESGGHESTQGGTLPNQIFMHFDGANARERLAGTSPFWLDWFFAHEAAHLYQQDKIGKLAGDDSAAWLHEGGADAMAALLMLDRDSAEQDYVRSRESDAEIACADGLAKTPLDRATAAGNFDLHYQCGLVIWLALDQELRTANHDGLNDLNRSFFEKVRQGEPWSEQVFLRTAGELGASEAILARIGALNSGGYKDAAAEVKAFGLLARQSLARTVIQE